MQYKNTLVAGIAFLFFLGLSAGFNHSNIYGDTRRNEINNRFEIHGVVSSIMGPIISILNDSFDIDANEAKIRLEDCNGLLTIHDIAVGDIIEVKGSLKNESIVAEKIKLKGPTKLEGTITEVGGSAITLLGQTIDTSSALCIKGQPVAGKKARVYVRNSNSGLIAVVIKVE